MATSLIQNQGFSYNPKTNSLAEVGTDSGNFVSDRQFESRVKLKDPTDKEEIAQAIKDYQKRPDIEANIRRGGKEHPPHIGGWIDETTKELVLDVSRPYDTLEQARAFALKNGQQSTFDMKRGKSEDLPVRLTPEQANRILLQKSKTDSLIPPTLSDRFRDMITGKGIPSRKGNPEGGFARWGTKDKAGNLKPGADQLDVIPPRSARYGQSASEIATGTKNFNNLNDVLKAGKDHRTWAPSFSGPTDAHFAGLDIERNRQTPNTVTFIPSGGRGFEVSVTKDKITVGASKAGTEEMTFANTPEGARQAAGYIEQRVAPAVREADLKANEIRKANEQVHQAAKDRLEHMTPQERLELLRHMEEKYPGSMKDRENLEEEEEEK